MYGTGWTAERVKARLVVAFARLPGSPVYSAATWTLEPADPALPVDGALLITATGLYLGFRSDARLCLLAWARARSTGRGGVMTLCQDMGRPRASLYRCVAKAAVSVAAGLNHRAADEKIAACG